MFIDIHCHIEDEENVSNIIDDYLRDGVDTVINSGANLKSSILSKELAKNTKVYILPVVFIHLILKNWTKMF